jgi:hypothetical protein
MTAVATYFAVSLTCYALKLAIVGIVRRNRK